MTAEARRNGRAWDDLIEKLRHGFYPTKHGERFTIHEGARARMLSGLLAINQERYAEEVAAGLQANGIAEPRSAKAMKPKARAKADGSAGFYKN